MAVVDERMDRKELDRRNTKVAQVCHNGCRREAAKRATHSVPDLRVAHSEPFDVQFVDYSSVPRALLRPPSPGEGRIDNPAFRNERRTVPIVEGQILLVVTHPIAEQGVIPFKSTDECFGIGVDEQFMVVEAVARLGFVRSVHSIAIELTRPHVGQIAMPDLVRVFRQSDPRDFRLSTPSDKQSSTLSAWAENNAKFVPEPSHVAPIGPGWPGHMRKSDALICDVLGDKMVAALAKMAWVRSWSLYQFI